MTVILGLNAYHADSAACLVVDGKLVAAAEEERFRRVKHWAGFPARAIEFCLRAANLRLEDVTYVAQNSDPRANLARKFRYVLWRRPNSELIVDRLRKTKQRVNLPAAFEQAFPDAKLQARIVHIEHHLAHLASSFLVSPFERAVSVSIDGFGDFASTAWGIGDGQGLHVDGRVHFPHSLGIFYQALTQFLGFTNYGDEYKVMGLAPLGQPRYANALRRVAYPLANATFELDLRYFRHHRERLAYDWEDCSPAVDTLYSPLLCQLLGWAREPHEPLEQRHRDIASSLQLVYEEVLFELLRQLHARYDTDALTIAGGCGANSVANGKIRLQTPFKDVYIQAAAGDAGGAIGAALIAAQQQDGAYQRGHMAHAYWGPNYSDAEITLAIATRAPDLQRVRCQVQQVPNPEELCQRVAQRIARGDVVGWFQGRMEWGPRALGNRSILCDPRRADMQSILNLKIKRRESFRPFAPSVLGEHVHEWFEQDHPVPFMGEVFQIRAERRQHIPAVTHVDGSGRLQTVFRADNPLYHQLITTFASLTGIPMLLNTSFNENEPVVCQPKEALDCFLRTQMDVLVLGHHLLERSDALKSS